MRLLLQHVVRSVYALTGKHVDSALKSAVLGNCLASRLLLLISVAFLCSSSAHAQITNVTNDQATPIPGVGHDYIKMLSETVQPSNGQLSIRIDVPTLPGRTITLPFAYLYNSAGLHHVVSFTDGKAGWVSGNAPLQGSGWSTTGPTISAILATNSMNFPGPPGYTGSCAYFTNYVFQDPTGARHLLPLVAAQSTDAGSPNHCGQVGGPGNILLTSDGTYTASTTAPPVDTVPANPPPVTVVGPDGTVYACPGGSSPLYSGWTTYFYGGCSTGEDRNGNLITSQPTISVTTTPENVPWQNFAFNSAAAPSNPPQANCFGISSAGPGQMNVNQSINLPNGKAYQFQYDPVYGLVSQITYPSGGYVKYSWGLNPISEAVLTFDNQGLNCAFEYDTPAVTNRYVSFDGVNVALEQDFHYSPTIWNSSAIWTSKQTIVVTKDCARNNFNCSGAPSFTTTYNYVSSGGQTGQETAVESSVIYGDFNGNTLLTVTKGWAGERLICELHSLNNGLISGTFYGYGFGDQVTDKKEYDYGLITSTLSCYTNGVPQAAPPTGITATRETAITYQSFPPTPSFPASNSIFDRPSSVITYGAGARVAETDYSYDQTSVSAVSANNRDETNYGPGYNNRGNATTIARQCFNGPCASGSPISKYTFYETGQVLSSKDPRGNSTQYSYTDNHTSCGGSAPPGSTNAYLTQITDALGHSQTFCYGYSDGQLRGATDPNGRTTTYQYNDSLTRPTNIGYPDGGQTSISYSDSAPSPSVTTSKLMTSGQSITNLAVSDGIGHVTQTQLTTDPDGADLTETTYDGLGRTFKQSNPHRSAGSLTDGTTTFTYDALGRTTTVTAPDTSTTTTLYAGNCVTVTDPAGKARKSCSDGLGRLTQVTEAPGGLGYVTSYSYDALNNLTGVVQNGSHNRSFLYDSLSRLTSATNPESHTIGYAYDANGNLVTKTDGRAISTSYSYDALNRVTLKNYSDGSLAMAYQYDGDGSYNGGGANGIGRMTIAANGDGSFADHLSYDPMGRVASVRHCLTGLPTNVPCWPAAYSYDFAGNLISLTYPSGRTVKYQYSGASRPNLVTFDNLNGISVGYNYLTGATYAPHGAPTTITLGNGLTETNGYNSRLQICSQQIASSATTLLNRAYNFYSTAGATCQPGTGGNNGNVIGIADNLVPGRTQAFSYDSLNRIATAQSAATSGADCWAQQFGYDAWGNLLTETPTLAGCPMTTLNVTVNANNQITNSGFSYDTAGNLLSDGTGGNHYAYDAESRVKSLNSGAAAYTYGTDGSRVIKQVGADQTDYIYSYANGEVLAEYKPVTSTWTDYVFVGSRRLASASATVSTPAGGSVVGDPLQNGGFEQGSANWSFGSSSLIITDSTRAHSGSEYLQISSSSLASAHSTQLFPVSAGNTVTFGGWAYRESGTTGSCRWKLEALDANQNPIAFLNPTPSDAASATWTFQIRTYTVPANVAFVFLYAEVFNATAPTVARFDDGFLDIGTGTADPGFEAGIHGWTVSGALTEQVLSDPTKAHSGNNYLELSTSTAGDAYSTSNLQIPVSVGQTVSYGGWRFHESGTFSYARWILVIQGVNGGQASHPPDDSVFGSWLFQTNSSLTVPTFLECPCTANLRIEMLTNAGDPVNAARFDDGFLTVTGDAAPTTNTVFYHGDQLGSTRLLTDSTGATTWSATYLPFGQEWNPQTTTNHYKFTGKERDSESNLDNFGARYFASTMGRFSSPDGPFFDQHASRPQSWNLYSYARNNPTRFTDADGRACVQQEDGNFKTVGEEGQSCEDAAQENRTVHASVVVNSNAPALWASDLEGMKRDNERWNSFWVPAIEIISTLAAFVDFGGADLPEELSPYSIRFSQNSVNEVEDVVTSMKMNGWQGKPIDVVKMPDGTLVTLDNTRLFAAGEAGINVKASVYDAGDMISPERGQAFLEQYGSRPSTWGDAVKMRIGDQNAGFRNTYPNGSPVTGVNKQ